MTFVPIFLASLATNIVYIALGSLLLIFPIGIIWGRLRPDTKPPLGDYESFAGLVVAKGNESWGTLSLKEATLRFAPHEGEAVEWPVSAMSHAVFGWMDTKFLVSVRGSKVEFNCFKHPLTAHPRDELSHAGRVRKEWRRQFAAAGVQVLEIERSDETHPQRTNR